MSRRSRRIETVGKTNVTETDLGWVVGGKAEVQSARKNVPRTIGIHLLDQTTRQFEKFWEIEDLPTPPEAKHSPNELACVQHYDATTTYGQDGRVIVRLPIDKNMTKYDPNTHEWMPDIGHSARRALGQFLHNEDKLSKNENARKQYVDFF